MDASANDNNKKGKKRMMMSNVSEASLERVRLNRCGNKRGHIDHKKREQWEEWRRAKGVSVTFA